uniref:Uncharacterized protein n=1 Tax=Anguilla anguilla TaxID=7936 RepID=A0A0E9WF45_ANGAN
MRWKFSCSTKGLSSILSKLSTWTPQSTCFCDILHQVQKCKMEC